MKDIHTPEEVKLGHCIVTLASILKEEIVLPTESIFLSFSPFQTLIWQSDSFSKCRHYVWMCTIYTFPLKSQWQFTYHFQHSFSKCSNGQADDYNHASVSNFPSFAMKHMLSVCVWPPRGLEAASCSSITLSHLAGAFKTALFCDVKCILFNKLLEIFLRDCGPHWQHHTVTS